MNNSVQPAFFLDNFTKFAKGLGVIGGVSGVLTGIAFVIGYIATKSFDEMLGIPSSTTLEETYVRTGLMFFPNTVHHITAYVSSLETSALQTSLIVAFTLALIGGLYLLYAWPFNRINSEKARLALVIAVNMTLIYGLASYLPEHVAPNHPYNKRVAFTNAPINVESAIDALGKEVNDAIRQSRGNSTVSVMYGKYSAVTFLCLLLVPAWLAWAKKLAIERDEIANGSNIEKKDGSSIFCILASIRTVQVGGILPLTIAAAVMIITLPASYGAMVLNGATICGEVTFWPKGEPEAGGRARDTKSGYLLSDLSNPKEPVIFLEQVKECDGEECKEALKRGSVFKLRQFDREKEISFVRLWSCSEELFPGTGKSG